MARHYTKPTKKMLTGATSKALGGKVDHRSGKDRGGYYIRTNSGRKLYWDHVDEHDYSIHDIAHSLASRVRWSGHIRRIKGKFWSIGQHSCLVHDVVEGKLKGTVMERKQALMHDAAEAYMPDFPSPLKWWMRACGNDELFKLENRVDEAISEHFGIDFPWSPKVKTGDLLLLATENRDFMPDGSSERNFMPKPLAMTLVPWSVERTNEEFLKRWQRIVKEENEH